MVNRRIGVMLFALLALVMVFGACVAPAGAPAAEGGEAPAGPVTITWGFWGSPEEKASHERVAEAFMAEHPEIQIDFFHEPWGDYFTKLAALWASGDSSIVPDVLFLSPIGSYAAEGVLEPLDAYIENSGYDVDDYWPSLLKFAMLDGVQYGFPRDVGLEVLYYNKDIFDEVGIDYPTDDWTWDDLAAAAEVLTVVDDNGRTQRYGLAIEGGKYGRWIVQNGGAILDDVDNPSICMLDQPEAIEALEFFAGLLDDGVAMRSAELSQAGGDNAVFQSGQAAMIIQNASRISQFNGAGMNYDVAPWPIPADGQRAASAAGAAWVMSALSDNKDEAWTFLSWLQSTDGGQRLYTEAGEIFPALMSTARSDAFLGQDQPPANRQAFITEGENAKTGNVFFIPEDGEIRNSIIGPALENIWAGEATPAELLPGLCEQVNAFLTDNGYPK